MDLQIKGRVALISGAAGGIGLATAKLLAEEGVHLLLTDKDQAALDKASADLPGDVLCVAADMTRQDEVDALVKAGEDRFGQIDIVVHAAGVTGAKGDPLELPDSDYQETWATDFFSAVRVARATVPAMRRRGWGRLVCITSENAVQPYWEERGQGRTRRLREEPVLPGGRAWRAVQHRGSGLHREQHDRRHDA